MGFLGFAYVVGVLLNRYGLLAMVWPSKPKLSGAEASDAIALRVTWVCGLM